MKKHITIPFRLALLLLVTLVSFNTRAGAQCKDWVPVGDITSPYNYFYQPVAVDGSGVVYVATRGSGDKLTVKKYSSGSWTVVGSADLSVGAVHDMDIKIDGSNTPYVAFEDEGASSKITVLKYNGTSWVAVGSSSFSPVCSYSGVRLAIDAAGTPYVAFQDHSAGDHASVMKYNGSSWAFVGGQGFSYGSMLNISLAIDNTTGNPVVAFWDNSAASKASVMKFNGSSWSYVGTPGISPSSIYSAEVAVSSTGTISVAYDLSSGGSVIPAFVKTFDGSTWNVVGDTIIVASSGVASLTYGPGDVLHVGTSVWPSIQPVVKKFEGGVWHRLGSDDPSLLPASTAKLAFGPDGSPYISVEDYSTGGVVKKYETISTTLTGTASLCAGSTTTFSHAQPGGHWSSAVSSVGTLGSTGIATTASAGLMSVSYTIGQCSATKTVTVNPYAGNIVGPLFLTQGTSTTFSSNVGGGTWSVSNSNATITSSGVLTGVTAGTTTVSYAVSSSCGVAYETKLLTIVATSPACHAWSQAGDVISPIGSGIPIIEMDGTGTPYVSYVDGFTMTGFIKKLNGSTWQSLGAEALGSGLYSFSTAVSPSGVVYAVTADASGTHTYRNEGSGWQFIANPVEYAEGVTLKTDAAGNLYATHTGYDPTLGLAELRMSKYNGSTWEDLGIVGYFYGGFNMAIAGATPYVAFADDANSRKITVRKYNGSAWVNVGAPLSVSEYMPSLAVNSSGIAFLALTYFGSWSSSHVFKFDGSSWSESTYPDGELMYPSVTMDPGGTPYLVGPSTSVDGGAVVFRNDGAGWIPYTRAAYYADVPTGVVDANGNIFLADHVITGTYSLVSMKYAPSEALPAITGPTSLCEGGYETLSNAVPFGVWSTSDPSVVGLFSSNYGDILGYFPGTATISYTNGSCSATVEVTVNAYGALPDIAGAEHVCNTGTTTLTNTAPGGMWSSSDPSKATVDYSSGVVSGVSVGSAFISYTLGSGCASTMSLITVDPPAEAGVVSGVDSMCQSSEFTFSSSVSGGIWDWHGYLPIAPYLDTEGYYLLGYDFSIPVAEIDHNTGFFNSGLPSILVPTEISIVYKVINGCGVDSASKTVTIMPGVIQAPIVGPSHLCVGETATYSYSGGTPAYWVAGHPWRAVVDSFTGVVTATDTGWLLVQLAWSNNAFCPSMWGGKWVHITTGAPTMPTITGPTTVMQGSTITLTGEYEGTWSLSNANVSIYGMLPVTLEPRPILSGNAVGTSTVSYTVSNACGTSVATHAVTVTLPPIVGPMVISGSGTTTLSNSTPGGAWSTGCNEIATVTSGGVVTGVSNGLATITYTVGGEYTTAVITVNMTTSAIIGTLTTCVGSGTTLSHPVSSGTWSSGTTAMATVSTGGVVTGIAVGNVNITYAYGSGCSSITTVTVNVAASAGTISGASTVCTGSTTTFSNATTGGVWSTGNAAVATISASTGVVTGVTAGNASITYTTSGSCGTATTTKAITVNATTVGAITGSGSVCTGATTTLGNSVAGGTWSTSDGAVAAVGASTGIVTGVSTGSATITYTISGACGTATATKVVTVGATASITGTLALCSGMTSTLSGGVYGGSWSSGNTAVATIGAANGVLTALSIGTANITYNLGGGCMATAAVTVSMPAIIAGTSNTCVGQTATLTDATSGGVWSSSNTALASVDAATGVVTGVAAGTTTISYIVSSGCYRTIAFTVKALPPAIAGPVTACEGNTVYVAPPSSNGQSWTSSNTSVAVIGSSTGMFTGVAAGTTTLTYTTVTGCFVTTTATVTEGPGAIAGTLALCSGSISSMSNTTSGGTWSSSNTSVVAIGSATGVVTAGTTGTATITYNTGGCRATAVVTVSPIAAITGTPSMCIGSSATLSNTTTGGTWSSSNTGIATVGTSGIVTGMATGNATITYTIASGCTRTVTATVVATPGAITGTLSICPATTSTLSGGTPGGTWSGGNASIVTINASTGVLSGVGVGTINVSYTLTGCRVTAIATVNPLPAVITGTINACVAQTSALGDATAGGAWSSSSTGIATVDASTGVVTGVSAATATMTYTLGTGCYRTTPFTVKALPPAIATTAAACVGTSTYIAPPSTNGKSWSSSNTAVATMGSSTGMLAGVSTGTTILTYTTTTGCFVTTEATVYALPSAGTITGPSSVAVGNTITLDNIATGGVWSSSNAAKATIGAATGVVTGVAGGAATISYSVSNPGCTVRATKAISVLASRPGGNSVSAENSLFQLYPNPTTGAFTVEVEEAGTFSIYSLDGKEVSKHNINAGVSQLTLSNQLASGIYMCRFTSESGNTTMVRLVYER